MTVTPDPRSASAAVLVDEVHRRVERALDLRDDGVIVPALGSRSIPEHRSAIEPEGRAENRFFADLVTGELSRHLAAPHHEHAMRKAENLGEVR